MALSEGGDRRLARRTVRSGAITAVGVGVFAGLCWTIGGASGWFAVVVAVAYAALYGVLVSRNQRVARARARALPERWSMSLAPTGRLSSTTRGAARATAARLNAPLSGRPCVAYEVGVRPDSDAAASRSTWTLIEQRVAPLEVDGRPVDPERTHLELTRTPWESTRDDAVEAFLRERGLAEPGVPRVLYESTIEDGDRVELAVVGEGATLRSLD